MTDNYLFSEKTGLSVTLLEQLQGIKAQVRLNQMLQASGPAGICDRWSKKKEILCYSGQENVS
jgi:hypothetical protein